MTKQAHGGASFAADSKSMIETWNWFCEQARRDFPLLSDEEQHKLAGDAMDRLFGLRQNERLMRQPRESTVYHILLVSDNVTNRLLDRIEEDFEYCFPGPLRSIFREALLEGIMAGETVDATAARLVEAYAGYWKGKPGMELARAEVIVITETTTLFALGMMNQAMRPEIHGLVVGFRYSSLLDGVTTPICKHLHNKYIKIDDPDLLKLRPANHFSCRSMLEPLTITKRIREDEWITPEEKRKAFELGMPEFM